jgi:hypothetical protein
MSMSLSTNIALVTALQSERRRVAAEHRMARTLGPGTGDAHPDGSRFTLRTLAPLALRARQRPVAA